MPTYHFESRICKICGELYVANILVASNTRSQSFESIIRDFRRHTYWLCDSCWDENHSKPKNVLKVYIPNELDFEKLENEREKDVKPSKYTRINIKSNK